MGTDLLLILVVVLIFLFIWRGPKMLPRIGEAFGKTIKGARENIPGALKDDVSESSESADPGDKTRS